MRRKVAVLHEHCAAEGRDPAAIARHAPRVRARDGGGEPREGAGAASVEEHVGRYRELAEAGVQTAIVGPADGGGAEPVARFAAVIAAFRPGEVAFATSRG